MTLMINHYWKNYNSGIYLQRQKVTEFFKDIDLWNILKKFYKRKKIDFLQIFYIFKGEW